MNQIETPKNVQHRQRKRATWLGIVAGIIAKFGTSTLLVGVAVVGGRVWAASVDAPRSWTEHMEDVNSSSWFLLQSINVLSASLAGWVAAWFSPPRSLIAPGVLVALAILAAAFAQLPATRSPLLLAVWALGAPIGLAVGTALHRRHERQA
ncbi:hypothetical protein [Pelomonas cellulosilytica]|uniref:Uncharacterized protein n=1 Tax=Pelomonas cellulosilytica TaxID=2906762 RepID=A0ABS8XX14_9BURK|nr:hypothetical protein [Pelomonas sp. P8]MCE4557192.1 hypothetical protein [Pelomonas sp. P8]